MGIKDLLFKSGTRAFLAAARQARDYSRFDLLHGYVYARWPYLYIGVGVGEHPLARWIQPLLRAVGRLRPPPEPGGLAQSYHGKVVTTAAARQLVSVGEAVRFENLEQIIPYRRARDLILMNPDHIVALQCPCRTARADPCLPLDVCLIIGEPFARFIADHHPRRARWISSQEAQEILEAEHRRGHVHHAFFKDAMLNRFYAICNCCPCCCGAMQAMRNGTPMLASSGYVSRVDEELCIACGDCAAACPFGAMSLTNDAAAVDGELCMGCGVCVTTCPQGALELSRAAGKCAPLEIQALLQGAAGEPGAWEHQAMADQVAQRDLAPGSD